MKRLAAAFAACAAAGLLLVSCSPRPAAKLVGSVSSEPQLASASMTWANWAGHTGSADGNRDGTEREP
mgnify:CR=1 FL=1